MSADVKSILRENGVGDPGSALHSWRCSHPDRYGPCDCFQELADDLNRTNDGALENICRQCAAGDEGMRGEGS